MFERKIELRETVYYDCSVDPEHRHKGEDAARRCFDRNQNKGPKKDHIERNIRIMEAYITGDETPQEIAERFGISRSRTDQIAAQGLSRLRKWLYVQQNSRKQEILMNLRDIPGSLAEASYFKLWLREYLDTHQMF